MKPIKVFVIQLFSAPHSNEFWKAVEETCNSTNGNFETFLAVIEPSDSPRLQDRIDSYIKKADICVADLIGTRNENVLLEVGAAYTLNIPVIPVSDKTLPTDIRGNLYIDLKQDEIGKENVMKKFKDALRGRLQEACLNRLIENKNDQFVVYGHASRRRVDFYSLINRCQDRIHILTTNLGFLVNEELICGMEPRKETLLVMLAKALKDKPRHFTMKILTLDPDSNFTNERALALNRDRQEFREHMRDDLNTVKEFVESNDCNASAQVKIYDEFPLQMTYFFDDYVVSSVVANSRSSRDCITYVHSLREQGAKDTYEAHFEQIWNKAELYVKTSKPAPRRKSWK